MPAIYADRTAALDNEVHDFGHFLSVGLESRYSPTIYFDSAFYASTAGLADDVVPLEHFLRTGATELRNPHPLVDLAYVMAQADVTDPRDILGWLASPAARLARLHPLFWSDYYLATNPTIGDKIGHPLHHYMQAGHRRRRSPHPFFAPEYYATLVEDLESIPCSPLEHWVTVGSVDDLIPTPLFDPEHYRSQTAIADDGAVAAFLHFLKTGLENELDPHPMFDSTWYRSRVPNLDEPPVLHYLRTEHRREQQPGPTFDPGTMQRIVVHDDFEFGGRILERYLAGGVTAVHVEPPLVLSADLLRQVEAAERILPRAALPYREAAAKTAPIRQNFNTHDTRRTNLVRRLDATPGAEGSPVVFIGANCEDETASAALHSFQARDAVLISTGANSGSVGAAAIRLDELTEELRPSARELNDALVEFLISRETPIVLGIGCPTFNRLVRLSGLPLSQLMSIAIVVDTVADAREAAGMIEYLDLIAVEAPLSKAAFVESTVLPGRFDERLGSMSELGNRLPIDQQRGRVVRRFSS